MERLKNGTIIRVTASDYDTRRLQGDLMEILGYSKSYGQYYVKAVGGQTCCYLNEKDIEVVEDETN